MGPLPVPPLVRCGRHPHLKGDPTLLLFLLIFATLSGTLFQNANISLLLLLLIVLLHVRQAVYDVLRQRAEALGDHTRVGVQNGGQVGLSQLLPVVERQGAWKETKE